MEDDVQMSVPDDERRMFNVLWELTHPEIRKIAQRLIASHRSSVKGVEPDDLVSELYLVLANEAKRRPTSEQQLRSQAAPLLRRLLVKSARKRQREEHFSPIDDSMLVTRNPADLSDLDNALNDLEVSDPGLVRIIEARLFAGLSLSEIAAAFGVSRSTVVRDWATAKHFLASVLYPRQPGSTQSQGGSASQELTAPEIVERPFGDIIVLDLISPDLMAAIRQDARMLGTLGWREFERLLAETLARLGYEVELQRGTKDGGIDIFAIKRADPFGPHRYLLQAKRSRNAIGVNPVRELLFLHQHHRMTRSCLATTSMFTRGAWKLAGEYPWQLDLKDAENLREWIVLASKQV
jgi:RNA polymerase sigma factor (TIGR02999 family)